MQVKRSDANTQPSKLTPARAPAKRSLGSARGRYDLPEGWEQPMSEAEYKLFTNEGTL